MLVWVPWGREKEKRVVSIRDFKPECPQSQARGAIHEDNKQVGVAGWRPQAWSKGDSNWLVQLIVTVQECQASRSWIYVKSPNVSMLATSFRLFFLVLCISTLLWKLSHGFWPCCHIFVMIGHLRELQSWKGKRKRGKPESKTLCLPGRGERARDGGAGQTQKASAGKQTSFHAIGLGWLVLPHFNTVSSKSKLW